MGDITAHAHVKVFSLTLLLTCRNSGFLEMSEQMGGGFKPIQHQSLLKMSKQIPEFGGDYANEDIPTNNKFNYIQHQSILNMRKQIPDQSMRMKQISEAPISGDDYADNADEEIPSNNKLSELNDDGSFRGGGGRYGVGNSVNKDNNVDGVGVDGGLDGVADNVGADYAEADLQDYLDLDKHG